MRYGFELTNNIGRTNRIWVITCNLRRHINSSKGTFKKIDAASMATNGKDDISSNSTAHLLACAKDAVCNTRTVRGYHQIMLLVPQGKQLCMLLPRLPLNECTYIILKTTSILPSFHHVHRGEKDYMTYGFSLLKEHHWNWTSNPSSLPCLVQGSDVKWYSSTFF